MGALVQSVILTNPIVTHNINRTVREHIGLRLIPDGHLMTANKRQSKQEWLSLALGWSLAVRFILCL